MAFDFKKEFKNLYQAKKQPAIVDVPTIKYIAVRGKGDPNEIEGEYATAVSILYAIAYTIRMSHKSGTTIPGYFEYVVPPLEGMWWLANGSPGMDYDNKAGLAWISLIRLPDFVTPEIFEWAKKEAAKKKKITTEKAEFMEITEGLTVQILHQGPYDDEPATVEMMHHYLRENGYELDFSDTRHHHEIYMSDPRKTAPEKLRTIIRHPIKKSS